MKKYFILMSAALVALSCAKELADPQEATGNENITYKTITFESIATKTTLDGMTGDVEWEEGDEISIYYVNEEGKPAETVATAASAGANTTFSAQIPETENPGAYYAAYPKGAGRLTVTEATAETPASVSFAVYVAPTQCDGTFKDANYAAAYTLAGESMTLAFKNAVGIVKVPLPKGGVISNNGKDYKISGVYVRGINGADANNGNVPVETAEGAVSGFGAADGSKNINLSSLSEAAIATGYAYLPTAKCNWTNGICVRFLSDDGAIPAVLSQDKSIVIERGHVLSLPDVSELVVFDYYVSLDGTGEGVSSDKPMSFAKMQEMFTAAGATMSACYKLDGTTFNLADGDYVLSETFTIPNSKALYSVRIKGNPESAAEAILNGNKAVGVIALNDNIHLTLESLAIKQGKAAQGGGINMTLSDKTTDNSFILDCKNCIFTGNVASEAGGGALFVNTGARGGQARFHECYFANNKATKEGDTSKGHGGVLYTACGQTAFFFNKCFFEGSAAVRNAAYIFLNDKTNYANRLGVNNCTINTGDQDFTNGTAISSVGYSVIVNTTLWARQYCGKRGLIGLGRGIAKNDPEGSRVINCFLKNNPFAGLVNEKEVSYDYKAFWNHSGYYQNISYCLYSGIHEEGATVEGDTPTYTLKNSYDYAAIGDVIGKSNDSRKVNGITLRTYKWSWTDAGESVYGDFVCPTYDQVRTEIASTTGVGELFLAWLDEVETDGAALKTDICNRPRDLNAMCPGSYQQADTPVPAN